MRTWKWMLAAALVCSAGCMKKIEEQTKATGSILGKTTQDVRELKPEEKGKLSDSKVRIEATPLGSAAAYRPMVEQAAKLQIEKAIQLYHATNDRYPKDHAEFMAEIVKANDIRLPVLPHGYEYRYDVANHQLEVVDKR